MTEHTFSPELEEIIDDIDLFFIEYFKLFFSGDAVRPLAQRMVRTILGREEITIREAHVEHEVTNAAGRSIRLDLWAVDEENAVYDVELQNDPAGANPQRARYYSSILDAKNDLAGVDARDLPKRMHPTYVIFITRTDVLKGGRQVYHIDRVIEETGEKFGDGSHIIYVNGSDRDSSTAIGKLIHDLCAGQNDSRMTQEFADRASEMQDKTEEARRDMGTKYEEYANKREALGRAEGRAAGRAEGAMSLAVGMVRDGLMTSDVAAQRLSMSEAAFTQKMDEYLRSNP